MSWDGLIAGAIRGGAEAAGQIADGNIRLRDEEAAFTRQQAATRANADYSSKISIERFNMEADRRLADAPKAAAAKIEEEKKSRLSQVAEVDSAQQGLAQQAITKKASAARGSAVAYEDLTPEEISKLGLTDGETSKLRTQAARNVGLIVRTARRDGAVARGGAEREDRGAARDSPESATERVGDRGYARGWQWRIRERQAQRDSFERAQSN
jgi:hypothetical protein